MNERWVAVREAASAWMQNDPDPSDRATVTRWLADDDPALFEAFGPRLAFGTAGLRGPMRPGPAGMNRALVRRVTAGLAAYLDEVGAQGPVVIGFDGRHGSRLFADDAARVLRASGRAVFTFPDVVPTPVVAWAVLRLGAAAGVVVTASHNPPVDNGYKVFWSDGAQIIAPHDRGVSAAIDAVSTVPWGDERGVLVDPSLIDAYVDAVLALRVRGPGPLRVVYTPMHGVGAAVVREVFSRAGYLDLHVVAEQAEPDGNFPTVAFPNPEEPGALDLAISLAERVDADVVLANDPDADRLAVAVRDDGRWRRLSGDEVGWLLAEELLSQGSHPAPRGVATTMVSSTRLASIAAAHGVEHHTTLTGFKWLARASMDLAARGGTLVLGYEEALGYSIGGLVRDKDGVSAALIMADLAAAARAEGVDLLERLRSLERRHGVLVGRQRSITRAGAEGKAQIAAAMAGLRASAPASLGGVHVDAFIDLEAGTRRRADGAVEPAGLPRSDVLGFELAGGHRALVRPSGTEPKLKLYVEARSTSPDLALAKEEAAAVAVAIEEDLLRRV
jgi:phosphomannomutase